MTVGTEGVTMGHERREVHATAGKMKGRQEVIVVLTKGKSITRMVTQRKEYIYIYNKNKKLCTCLNIYRYI